MKADLHRQSESTSELLFGESIQLLEQNGEWSRVRSACDDYEGYVEASAFEVTDSAATHWVSTRATPVFEHPDIKSHVALRLMFGSELTVSETNVEEKFLQLTGGGYVWSDHCLEKHILLQASMVEIAQSNYWHTPYKWGGRSTDGCDCSGLVQMLAMARGVNLPRDSIDQENALTINVDFERRAAEDLVFWPGHVGILQSPEVLWHATAHTLRCCVEPLQVVIQRAGQPSSIKRIS